MELDVETCGLIAQVNTGMLIGWTVWFTSPEALPRNTRFVAVTDGINVIIGGVGAILGLYGAAHDGLTGAAGAIAASAASFFVSTLTIHVTVAMARRPLAKPPVDGPTAPPKRPRRRK